MLPIGVKSCSEACAKISDLFNFHSLLVNRMMGNYFRGGLIGNDTCTNTAIKWLHMRIMTDNLLY